MLSRYKSQENRPMQPQPAGSLQASSKSQRSRGDQLQHYVFISVQRGDGDSCFLF